MKIIAFIDELWRRRGEFRKARYNTKTGISGASEGSPYYLHEEGHKRQPPSFRLVNDLFWLVGFPAGVLSVLAFFLFNAYLLTCILVAIFFACGIPFGYTEFDAWGYSYKKWGNNISISQCENNEALMMKNNCLYFEPTEVIEAVREIGKISNYMDLAMRCKTREEMTFTFTRGVARLGNISNVYLRNAVINLFAEYIGTTDTHLYPLLMYYKSYEEKQWARQTINLIKARFAKEYCGIKTFDLILSSQRDKLGRFEIEKTTLESEWGVRYYGSALNKKIIDFVKKLDEKTHGSLTNALITDFRYGVTFMPTRISQIKPVWRNK